MTKEELLKNPEMLLRKRPFLRGSSEFTTNDVNEGADANILQTFRAKPPHINKKVVTQERFAKELDPMCHNVIYDQNIPSICVKLQDGSTRDIMDVRVGIPIQARIREKQTLCMCGHPSEISLLGTNPSERDKVNSYLLREYWNERNIDGLRTQAVYGQKGYGDIGMLAYHNSRGEINFRIISYEDGYTIITHKDENGEHILECVYYLDEEHNEVIDCYDDTYHYRYRRGSEGDFVCERRVHGFDEIPLATKRGDVAWNEAQGLIDMYEIMYNILLVIQKRFGYGILYVKGRFKSQAEQIAGNIILNDTNPEGKGDVKLIKNDASQNMIEYLGHLFEQIQIASSTTFLLPKDIKSSGDISAIAIMLTQSLDLECANRGVAEWQNFMNKVMRLFKQGLARELVTKGINPHAITEFASLRIGIKMKVWRPFNETEYNQMLCTLKGAGILSTKTAIEKCTVGNPDEEERIRVEAEEK